MVKFQQYHSVISYILVFSPEAAWNFGQEKEESQKMLQPHECLTILVLFFFLT